MATILVIDNDTSVREKLYEVLSQQGQQVLATSSGSHAMELLKTKRPHLILLDTVMPGASGLETAEQIRSFDSTVPIVLLAESGEPEVSAQDLERIEPAKVLVKQLEDEQFLKALTAEVDAVAAAADGSKAKGGPGVTGLFLVIDDDPAAQQMMQLLFESKGFQVILAGSGEEGLEQLTKKPQAVLLDVGMPGMDGLMTLRKIKAKCPDLPVIMVSAYGEEETVREALKSGAYDYVTKPFSIEYLETVVLTKLIVGLQG